MLGAIIGDIIGSVYEFESNKTKDFELFPEESRPTDDSLVFLEQLRNGCDLVDEAHLEDLIDWVKNWKEKKK